MKKRKRRIEVDINELDVLNLELLRRFVSGEGKSARIASRFSTGVPAFVQRKLCKAIKRARQLNLM